MKIKSLKWKRVLVVYSLVFSLITILEILPRLITISSNIYDSLWQEFSPSNPEENRIIKSRMLIENKKLKKELAGILSNSDKAGSLSSTIELIDNISQKCDLEIQSIQPGNIKKENDLVIQSMDLVILSEYENFYNFARFVENASRIMLLRKIIIKQEKSGSDKLVINTKLDVYLNL